MSDHTRVPTFPQNLQDYAPWVSTHGLVAPYGLCQCGCGQKTSIAIKTEMRTGCIKGKPKRFVYTHCFRYPQSPMPGVKRCTICRQVKPLVAFSLMKRGRRIGKPEPRCIECNAERARARMEANPEIKIRARESFRSMSPEKRAITREKAVARHAANRDKIREQDKLWSAKHPEQKKARNAVRAAVQNGSLPPASSMVCEECKEALAADYHHHKGYAEEFWLDVVAVCKECHGRTRWIQD